MSDQGDADAAAVAALVAGDRRALARTITLLESTRPSDRVRADRVLAMLPVDVAAPASRIGISGAPGAGKSSFIDTFGMELLAQGHRVAVLAIDPSSARSGGSILGDKTRMARLSREPNAFIRPTPAQGLLGGVARHTRECMLVCEAAGFDVVLIETVGVGQSEVEVADLVDTVVVLLLAGGGDDLQGIKRGLLECTDIVVVPKADGEGRAAAMRAVATFQHALSFVPPRVAGWSQPVLACSALSGDGIAAVREAIWRHRAWLREDGQLEAQRAAQRLRWTESAAIELLRTEFHRDAEVASLMRDLTPALSNGSLAPDAAARQLVACFRGRPDPT